MGGEAKARGTREERVAKAIIIKAKASNRITNKNGFAFAKMERFCINGSSELIFSVADS